MGMELRCDCGNPLCKTWFHIRVGYVQIHHPDGSKEERWDHLHLDGHDYDPETSESAWMQAMYDRSAGVELMWYLMERYLPLYSRVHHRVHDFVREVRYFLEDPRGYAKDRKERV